MMADSDAFHNDILIVLDWMDRGRRFRDMFVIVLALYAVLSVGGLSLFKLGAQHTLGIGVTSTAFSLQISWLSLLGLLLYVCSFLIYMGLVS